MPPGPQRNANTGGLGTAVAALRPRLEAPRRGGLLSTPVAPNSHLLDGQKFMGRQRPVTPPENDGTTLFPTLLEKCDMPRSRPASSPLSFHKATGQYYVTRGGRRIYLGANGEEATARYHRLALGLGPARQAVAAVPITCKELANRFLAAQQANWRARRTTLRCYRDWLRHFLEEHGRLLASDLTVEAFAAWKLSLVERGYSAESINHYLSAVRAMFAFGVDTDLIARAPRLRRVRNVPTNHDVASGKPLYAPEALRSLLAAADVQMRAMVLLSLNCGFGPKDNAQGQSPAASGQRYDRAPEPPVRDPGTPRRAVAELLPLCAPRIRLDRRHRR